MGISLFQKDNLLNLEVGEEFSQQLFSLLGDVLDHATLRKEDVNYDGSGTLAIRLRRNLFEKGLKPFLWFKVWRARPSSMRLCLLTITDVISCDVRDEAPPVRKKGEISLGGISFGKGEIYLGSFCDYENAYGITVKVKRINVSLTDLE